MATAPDVADTCAICTDRHTDPCTLRCRHIFCGNCISQYLQTTKGIQDSKVIPCPVCRQTTDVPDPSQPISKWAEQMQSYPVASDNTDTETEKKDNCFLCNEKEEMSPGKIWCQVCEMVLCGGCSKSHSLVPATRDHEVTDLTGKFKVKIKRKTKCKEHPQLHVEFCCKSCGKAVCQTCCILYHRKCENVVTISSMIPEMTSHLKQNSVELSEWIKTVTSTVTSRKALVAEADRSRIDFHSKVEVFCQRAHDLIKKKKEELEKELKLNTDEKTKPFRNVIETGEQAIKMYQQRIELIDQALETEDEMDMFNLFQSSPKYDADLVCSSMDHHDVTVALKSEFDVPLSSIAKSLDLSTLTDPNSPPKLFGCLKTNRATDIVVLVVNGFETCIVTDDTYDNKWVRAFYIKDNETSELKLVLDGFASGIAKMSDNQVAVSVPNVKLIVLLKVSPELSIISKIVTSKGYYGLGRVNKITFAAGNSDSIDILNISGGVIKTLSAYTCIKFPRYIMSTTEHSLLVSDSGTNSMSVYMLTTDETLQFHYNGKQQKREFGYNTGMTMTKSGEILVADRNKNKIVLLSKKGEFVSDVLTGMDGIFQPLGLCLHKNRLYVSQNSGPIMIYRFP